MSILKVFLSLLAKYELDTLFIWNDSNEKKNIIYIF